MVVTTMPSELRRPYRLLLPMPPAQPPSPRRSTDARDETALLNCRLRRAPTPAAAASPNRRPAPGRALTAQASRGGGAPRGPPRGRVRGRQRPPPRFTVRTWAPQRQQRRRPDRDERTAGSFPMQLRRVLFFVPFGSVDKARYDPPLMLRAGETDPRSTVGLQTSDPHVGHTSGEHVHRPSLARRPPAAPSLVSVRPLRARTPATPARLLRVAVTCAQPPASGGPPPGLV